MAEASKDSFVGGGGDTQSLRVLTTPEGIPITIQLGQRGERAAAVVIDLLIIFGSLIVLFLAFLMIAGITDIKAWFGAPFILVSFAIRSFYFAYFELRWQGTTPGKRIMGLRVVDNKGGHLKTNAVLARNLMREVELFLPVQVLMMPQASSLDGALEYLTVILWLGVLVLLPFFNKNRQRAGDMVGGTWVIAEPKVTLLRDVADAAPQTGDESEPTAAYQFSPAQLDAYGIYELQILEDLLRRTDVGSAKARLEVYQRIAKKINWRPHDDKRADVRAFLEAYYTALRAHLEKGMLFGKRRKDKHDKN